MDWKKETEQNILKASEELTGESKDHYIKFMQERFGDSYQTLGYALEWAERIKHKKFYLMDNESRDAWLKATGGY